jgi:hypothetical protein
LSLADHPRLFASLTPAAGRGVPVLCLAPADGRFPWPGDDDPAPERLSLRRADAIVELDRRLDARTWLPDGKSAPRGVLVAAHGGHAVGEVCGSERAWPWFEVRYARAPLLVCGFDVIRRWDDGPTPRFLLARVFDYLTERSSRKD